MAGFSDFIQDHRAEGLRALLFIGVAPLLAAWLVLGAWRFRSGVLFSSFNGRDLSELSLVDAEGASHRIGDLQGRVVVLDFWATWCPPCRMSMPELAAMQARQGDQYAVVPVSLDRGGFGDVTPFLRQNAMGGMFTVVPADPAGLESRVGSIQAIPTTLVLDRAGRVARSWTGYAPGRLDHELQAVLGTAGPAPAAGANPVLPGIPEPDFLVLFPAAALLALGAGLVLFRAVLRTGTRALPQPPDSYFLGFLRNRARGLLEVALTRLSVMGLAGLERGVLSLYQGAGAPDLNPVDTAVLSLRRCRSFPDLERAFRTGERARLASYERMAQAAGLIPDARQEAVCRWVRRACSVAVLGLGGARWAGAPAPSALLLWETLTLAAGLYWLLRTPRTTPLGRAMLRHAAAEVRAPLAAALRSDQGGTVPLSLAVAAMGPGALAGTPYADLCSHLRRS